MPLASGQRASFFPKADAAVLQSKHAPPTARPDAVGPVFDVEHASKAINAWSADVRDSVYPQKVDIWGAAPIPDRLLCTTDRYLHPILTENERLRLTLLWYYTRNTLDDAELLSRLQEKVHLAKETIGWEFVIVGLLDHNTYTRLVTVGLPLAILPRRESTCAHTVNQPPGAVFILPNMMEDWRFCESPHVSIGGLRAYAGAPLRFDTEFGDHVALGSLCVASNTKQESLSKAQQMSLSRLADWVVADIVHSARARRQRERRRMLELITNVQRRYDSENPGFEEAVLDIIRTVFPQTTVTIQPSKTRQIRSEGLTPFSASELDHGLWEDSEYIDYFIEHLNYQDPDTSKVVRVIAAECDNTQVPTWLVVASGDLRHVFDDVDAWFVQSCASLLARGWQSRLLKEALKAKEKFLRGITHQLRTPIHGILGSVELLAEELKSRDLLGGDYNSASSNSPITASDTEQFKPSVYLNTIRTSGRDLIATVNGMIKLNRWAEVAQTERADVLHHIRAIETGLLHDILQNTSDDPSAQPSVFFDYLLPNDTDTLSVDLALLKDCVQPLVINAMQNAPGGIVQVILSVTDDFQGLTVDVKDDGRGIHSNDHLRIFDAYEKVDVHTTGGGLGLHLASKLATLLNGSISLVASEVGKGSHFRASFEIPASACTYPRPKRFREHLSYVPRSFHIRFPKSDILSLQRCFGQQLINYGFTASEDAKDSLVLLQHSTDLATLHRSLAQIPANQVAICLVPASGYAMNLERLRRENNVVYVKGPFLSVTLEEALQQTNSILSDLALLRANRSPPPVALYSPMPKPVAEGAFDNEYETLPPLPGSPEQGPALVKPLQALHIETKPVYPVWSPLKAVAKPFALLVDDNAINLRIMQMYCSKRGIPYCCATDGLQAVGIFSQRQTATYTTGNEPIELILMDLQMPVCDGIEACRQIRELEGRNGWKQSIVFIVTGQDSPSDRTNAEGAGANGYFVKPVGPKILDRGVKQYFPAFDGA